MPLAMEAKGPKRTGVTSYAIASRDRILQPKPRHRPRKDVGGGKSPITHFAAHQGGQVLGYGEGLSATNRKLLDFTPRIKPQSLLK